MPSREVPLLWYAKLSEDAAKVLSFKTQKFDVKSAWMKCLLCLLYFVSKYSA